MGIEIVWVRGGERAAFHPGGDLIAVVGSEIDGVELLDRSGRMFERFASGKSYRQVLWSPQGAWLALASADSVDVLRLDPEWLTSIALPKSDDAVSMAFGEDDQRLYIKPARKKLQEYSIPSMALVARYLDLEEFRGGAILGARGDRFVFEQGLFDRRTEEIVRWGDYINPIRALPDGDVLFRGPSGLELHDPAHSFSADSYHEGWFDDAALAHDRSFVVTIHGQTLTISRTTGHTFERLAEAQMFGASSSIIASPTANDFVIGVEGQLALVNCSISGPFPAALSRPGDHSAQIEGKLSLKSALEIATDVQNAAFSPDGTQIAAILNDGITLFDIEGKKLRQIKLSEGYPTGEMLWSGDRIVLQQPQWGSSEVWLVDPLTGDVRVLPNLSQVMYGASARWFGLKPQGAVRSLDPTSYQTIERWGDLDTFEPTTFTVHPHLPWAVGQTESYAEHPGLEVHDLARGTSTLLRHEPPYLLRWRPDAPVLILIHSRWIVWYDLHDQRVVTRIQLPFPDTGTVDHVAMDASGSSLVMSVTSPYDYNRCDLFRVNWINNSAHVTEMLGSKPLSALSASPVQPGRLLLVNRKRQLRRVDVKVSLPGRAKRA